jgi:undecaprenyl-diphosphatase
MSVIQAVLLGIVQGLTEFLPVSSSGHLAVLQNMFGFGGNGVLTFDIALHLATLAAVTAALWREVLAILRKPLDKLTWLLVTATVPMVVVGVLFKDRIEAIFNGENLILVGACFLVTAIVLFAADRVREGGKDRKEMTFLDAAIIGVAQCVAILPGISRSGATISASLFAGLKRDFAIRFSFLMAIPAILGPAAVDGVKLLKAGGELGIEPLPLVAGMLAAGLTGFFAVKIMLRLFSRIGLRYFSYYLLALGAIVLAVRIFILK